MADEADPEIKVAEPGKFVDVPIQANPVIDHSATGLGLGPVHMEDGKLVPGAAPEMKLDQHQQWTPVETHIDEASGPSKAVQTVVPTQLPSEQKHTEVKLYVAPVNAVAEPAGVEAKPVENLVEPPKA